MTEDTRHVYRIAEDRMDAFCAELAKFNKRAEKLGCEPLGYDILGTDVVVAPKHAHLVHVYGIDNLPHIKYTKIAFVGVAPKLAGWSFIGKLDHTTIPGQVIVQTIPGEVVPPEYFNNDPVCDHCHVRRRRNDTFILRHEDGTHKQVGRQCLKDFMGHDPSKIISLINRLFKFVESDEERWGFGGGSQYYAFDHHRILQVTCAVIHKQGWVPRSACGDDQIATADEVLKYFMPPYESRAREMWERWRVSLDADNPKFEEEAIKAREWLDVLEDTGTSEYIHNLKVLAHAQDVPTNMFGYWCSVVAAYQKAMERLRLQEKMHKLNEYAGNAKQKITCNVKVMGVRAIDGYYGVTRLFKMIDQQGRTLVWFASSDPDMEPGHEYHITGTIKKLEEYQGWKQTVLTRVKVLENLSGNIDNKSN